MDKKFEFGAADELFQRILSDESGDLEKKILDVMLKCKELSEKNVPLEELATACTMGWYMGQDPSIRAMVEFMFKMSQPPSDVMN
tara:strand:+ start:102 stop:356 length:255 start_codon:yes stop_codon:yes gene_type:complete